MTILDSVLASSSAPTMFDASNSPVGNICAHLNAFHVYASDPSRTVETNHYCSHLTPKVRQCILYDGPGPKARLIGVEYMVTSDIFETLPADEKKLWHSHVFEVKSGMLVMPQPDNSYIPMGAWDAVETKEMEAVVTLYGKVYHLWQTDRGDELPLGQPQLMTSLTEASQMKDFEKTIDARDEKLNGVEWRKKRDLRKDIPEMKVDEHADWTWKKGNSS
ncbi:DUF1264-domain-containing protein [Myriangium duriaei CBS 260.36]|uniref:DUF1264-domain-containing protein n=1 Tax=Myriangium duriaei CBS 260.36 TaxID=1168546 RepID=A0A9P4MFE6_9PEZI|nr:DUF1264-domain-containing protein [Myriangium duriaei CBS 260.36]